MLHRGGRGALQGVIQAHGPERHGSGVPEGLQISFLPLTAAGSKMGVTSRGPPLRVLFQQVLPEAVGRRVRIAEVGGVALKLLREGAAVGPTEPIEGPLEGQPGKERLQVTVGVDETLQPGQAARCGSATWPPALPECSLLLRPVSLQKAKETEG